MWPFGSNLNPYRLFWDYKSKKILTKKHACAGWRALGWIGNEVALDHLTVLIVLTPCALTKNGVLSHLNSCSVAVLLICVLKKASRAGYICQHSSINWFTSAVLRFWCLASFSPAWQLSGSCRSVRAFCAKFRCRKVCHWALRDYFPGAHFLMAFAGCVWMSYTKNEIIFKNINLFFFLLYFHALDEI